MTNKMLYLNFKYTNLLSDNIDEKLEYLDILKKKFMELQQMLIQLEASQRLGIETPEQLMTQDAGGTKLSGDNSKYIPQLHLNFNQGFQSLHQSQQLPNQISLLQ